MRNKEYVKLDFTLPQDKEALLRWLRLHSSISLQRFPRAIDLLSLHLFHIEWTPELIHIHIYNLLEHFPLPFSYDNQAYYENFPYWQQNKVAWFSTCLALKGQSFQRQTQFGLAASTAFRRTSNTNCQCGSFREAKLIATAVVRSGSSIKDARIVFIRGKGCWSWSRFGYSECTITYIHFFSVG